MFREQVIISDAALCNKLKAKGVRCELHNNNVCLCDIEGSLLTIWGNYAYIRPIVDTKGLGLVIPAATQFFGTNTINFVETEDWDCVVDGFADLYFKLAEKGNL
jgi:hypothetical protein